MLVNTVALLGFQHQQLIVMQDGIVQEGHGLLNQQRLGTIQHLIVSVLLTRLEDNVK
jgi:hypothetical protein